MRAIYDKTQENKEPLSAAVLVRTNRHASEIARHLEAEGVPYEIVGLGGLLWEPEIQDLVALETMLVSPQDSAAALSILDGTISCLIVTECKGMCLRSVTLHSISTDRLVLH